MRRYVSPSARAAAVANAPLWRKRAKRASAPSPRALPPPPRLLPPRDMAVSAAAALPALLSDAAAALSNPQTKTNVFVLTLVRPLRVHFSISDCRCEAVWRKRRQFHIGS